MASPLVVEPLLHTLERLLEARSFSEDLGGDIWDFAVDLEALRRIDASDSLLRWLLLSGYAEHRIECTRPEQPGRQFDSPGPMIFLPNSCFILTSSGVECLFALREGQLPDSPALGHGDGTTLDFSSNGTHTSNGQGDRETESPVNQPVWDPVLKELTIGGLLVKRYKLRSPNQERVLSAFEEEGWPVHIDDPLPPHSSCAAKTRLRDTIKNLNRHQKARLIRFVGDGTGEGVRWQRFSKVEKAG